MKRRTAQQLCVLIFIVLISTELSIILVHAQMGESEFDFSDELLPALSNNTYYSPTRDFMTDSVIAPDDSVYALGPSLDEIGTWRYGTAIARWDPMGNLLWGATWYESNHFVGYGICLGADGVYIVGSGLYDICIAKWSYSGTRLWNLTIDTGFNEQGFKITVDPDENMYVYGYREGLVEDIWIRERMLLKVAPTGDIEWIKAYPSSYLSHNMVALAYHPDGYILARTMPQTLSRWKLDGTPDFFQTSLNESYVYKFILDNEGNIITYNPTVGYPVLQKWSSEGNGLWNLSIDSTIHGLPSEEVTIESITTTITGDIFVLLKYDINYYESGRSIVRVTSAGEPIWRREILDSFWITSYENEIHVGTNGLLYVAGTLFNGRYFVIDERGPSERGNRDIVVGVFDPKNSGQYVLYRITPALVFVSVGVVVLLVGYRFGINKKTDSHKSWHYSYRN